jgi:hypothetical protein
LPNARPIWVVVARGGAKVSAALDDARFTLGEGPFWEAVAGGSPVLVPDLSSAFSRRPAFAPAALGLGMGAVFAFPLRIGAICVGALLAHRGAAGPLEVTQLADALALADAMAVLLLHCAPNHEGAVESARGRPLPGWEQPPTSLRGGFMEAFSEWVVRHRLMVGLLWLAVTLVGLVIAPSVSGRLQSGVNLTSSAYTANQQIAQQYGGAAEAPGLITMDLPAGQSVTTPTVKNELASLDGQIARDMPTLREASYASTGSRSLVGKGAASTLILVHPPHSGEDIAPAVLDQLTAAAKPAVPGSSVHATG